MPSTSRKVLRQLLEQHGPIIQEAFLQAVANTTNGVSIKSIAAALERADYDMALDILGLTGEAFETVAERVQDAYLASGRASSSWIGGVSSSEIRLQFKPGNPVAAQWLRDKSSTLVQHISDGQRISIREALEEGMERGLNPRTAALDVAGRIPKGSNSRRGGLVGLTRKQSQTVTSLRDDLISGDPSRMKRYFRLKLRDKRFDGTVFKAIRENRGLSQAEVNKISGRYADKALKWRADNIARTEVNQAFHAAQDHSFQQAIESGHASIENVRKTWHSSRDDRVRFSHSVLNGTTLAMDDVFVSPIGSMLRHPGDVSLGASTEDIAGCRCRMSYTMEP